MSSPTLQLASACAVVFTEIFRSHVIFLICWRQTFWWRNKCVWENRWRIAIKSGAEFYASRKIRPHGVSPRRVCLSGLSQSSATYIHITKWGFTQNWDTFQTDTKHCPSLGISSPAHVIIRTKVILLKLTKNLCQRDSLDLFEILLAP